MHCTTDQLHCTYADLISQMQTLCRPKSDIGLHADQSLQLQTSWSLCIFITVTQPWTFSQYPSMQTQSSMYVYCVHVHVHVPLLTSLLCTWSSPLLLAEQVSRARKHPQDRPGPLLSPQALHPLPLPPAWGLAVSLGVCSSLVLEPAGCPGPPCS